MKKVNVIGSGFSGLSAASFLAKEGYEVSVFEKNDTVGGRCRQFSAKGFTFDMGPSWYWMPDVFENFFNQFGYQTSDFYELKRLDPSYRVYFGEQDFVDLPASYPEFRELFESIEEGSAAHLDKFLSDAAIKYNVGMNKLVFQPGKSLTEYMTKDVMSGIFKLQLFTNIQKVIRQKFKNEKLRQILEFPVLFLGAKPSNTPALYSLMNYADIKLGTWYPMGGMYEIVKAMEKVAIEQGVTIHTNKAIEEIPVHNHRAMGVKNGQLYSSDFVVAGADYHHVDKTLLQPEFQNYSEQYWDKRTMAPSSLLFYIGVDKKLNNLKHHNLFFDADFEQHASEIYDHPSWPTNPLFYVCAPSVTDPSVAPDGHENLFILMPIASDIEDNEQVRQEYFEVLMNRLEKITGQAIKKHIVYQKSYCKKDFVQDYNSFKGNAYGLANTLNQTAILKPSIRNKKVNNLLYTGQLTVPGPGVPPSLISGQVVANEIIHLNK